jgi:glycosyltransferase involved in cell wall biosynthesis
MRILALTRYERLGSSSRVRFYQYFPYLEAKGVKITSAPFFKDSYVRSIYQGRSVGFPSILQAYIKRLLILLTSSKYDVLWLEKELFPWLPAWFESFLHTRGIPYVVDYDDAVFHRYDMHGSGLVRSVLGRKIDHVMRRASMVIVGNDYLAERSKQAGASRVEYLPSVVDVSRYKVKKTTRDELFRVGWIGSPVTAPYLDVIRDALDRLSRAENIHVTLIGSGKIAPFHNIPTTILPWDEEMEQSIGEMFDAGIMPLVDGPFERGKCGYKLVQYMAGGLPVIASPVGINEQMVIPGENGYLASSSDEWVQAFQALIHDLKLRADMGEAGRQKAEQMYNLRVTAPRLLELLSSMRKV